MKIKFMPQNLVVEASSEKSLLKIATENKIEIRSICKGVPSCAECRIRITEGERNVLPPTKAELNLIGTSYFIDGRRLSCQVRCFGDITVDLSEQLERADNQNKKIRGYRSSKTAESQAVNDTLLLNENEDTKESPQEDSLHSEVPGEASNSSQVEPRRESKGGSHRGQSRHQNKNSSKNSGRDPRRESQKNTQKDSRPRK